MRSSSIFLTIVVACVLLSTSVLHAQSTSDRVQRRNGIDMGSITAVTPLGVTISKGGVTSKISTEEIRSIQFDGEPASLNSARTQFTRGRYDNAADALKKVDRSDITRPEVAQEYDYMAVASLANLALAGKTDRKEALAEVSKFLTTNKTSFHVPEVIELQGDLYRATGDLASAQKKYETLAKAPSEFYKARSAMLVGELLQDQGNHAEAIPRFDEAIATAGVGTLTADIKRRANFGRAASLAATGKPVEGANLIKHEIANTATNDTAVLAEGYNALGECYLAAGDSHAAREAFLHVDLLFNGDPTEHARTLYRLTNLWKELRQPTRAADAQQRLSDDYPLSRWAGR